MSLSAASATVTSSNFFDSGEIVDGRVVQFAQLLHQLHEFLGDAEAPCRRRRVAGDRVQYLLDLFLERRRRDGQQAGADRVLGAAQQIAHAICRQIGAKAENLDQFVVGRGAGDDAGKAFIGKPRAGIVGQFADHLAFAAIDDDVGDGGGQVGPAGNGEQMVLSLAAGDLDQHLGSEPAGIGEHAAGDLDLVVPGEMLDHLERRVVERRQPLRELGLRPRLDACDQEAEHVVEDLDLVVAETFSVMEEEIGDLPQGFHPLGRRTASYGFFEFGDDRVSRLLHHSGQPVGC